ncbi:MAG: hypothetical protein IJ001_07150 [Oscillospiraceae bacterium]|nr:hypothetical protein [Oscillospiraceae bacterium]
MYEEVSKWIDNLPLQSIPEEVTAFCFNLYDGCDNLHWSMELIGASRFDVDDEDWACDEITDFESRTQEFKWTKEASWDVVFAEMLSTLKEYLEKGQYADALKSKHGVGAGFTEGNIEILYSK